MEPIFEKAGHIEVTYNERKRYVLFHWTSFYVTLDEIQELHRKALDFARTQRCVDYVADTLKVTNALPQPVVQWWGETWVPTLSAYGLRSIITIVPKAAMAMLSTHRWQKHVKSGIAMANVNSRLEAESMLGALNAA
jgi:hypothetical protein